MIFLIYKLKKSIMNSCPKLECIHCSKKKNKINIHLLKTDCLNCRKIIEKEVKWCDNCVNNTFQFIIQCNKCFYNNKKQITI